MARPPRLELPGVPLHVIQRGVNRAPCFFNDVDRRFYLKCLAKYAIRRHCAIHAYVLMMNHVHLLVTPAKEGAVSALIQDVGRTYVRTINSIHGRSGTLWDGRFKSSLVDTETYLLTCHRYIELNPVRAGMVKHPAEYAWSSHGHYGRDGANSLIVEHECYRRLANDPRARSAAYSELFESALPDAVVELIRTSTNAGAAIGSEGFIQRMSRLAGRDVRIPKRGRPSREDGRIINKLL